MIKKILVKEVKTSTGYPLSMLEALALTEDGKDFVMEDADAEMPFRDDISNEARAARENIVD